MPDYNQPSAHIGYRLRTVIWLLVSLVVFACLPGMMSGNYLPKTFWAAAMVGVGFVLYPPRKPYIFDITLLGLVWLTYLGWALLSLSWAIQPRVGFERWLALILPTLAYLLARRIRFWEADLFWKWFSVIFSVVALIGVLQYFFPSFPLIHSFPGTAIPRGTMGQRNYTGMYFMVTLPFVVWDYFHLRGRAVLLTFIALLLGVSIVLLTQNRGAWFGLAGGVVFFLFAGGFRNIFQNRRRVLLIIGVIFFLILLAITVKPPEQTIEGMGRSKAKFSKTVVNILDPNARIKFWQESLGLTDPFFGAGFGNLPIVATPFTPGAQVKTLNWEVHNDYLQAYVDLGIPGVLLFTLTFILLIRLAWKGRTHGLILAAGASIVGLTLMQFTTFTSEKISTQIWIAGVAAILNSQAGKKPLFRMHLPAWSKLSVNYLIALWLFLFAWAVSYTIIGDREFRKEREEIKKVLAYQEVLDSPERYSKEAREFVRKEGLYDRIKIQNRFNWLVDRVLPTMLLDANMRHISCHQFAGLAMNLKDYDAAAAFAGQALDLHPNDWTSLFYLCQIALADNNYSRALKLLERGVESFGYNPYLPFYGDNLIMLYNGLGYPDRARAIREKMEANRVIPPSNPSPGNRLKDVPVEYYFNWDDCHGAESYALYLWRVGEATPAEPVVTGLSVSEVRLNEELAPGTTYIWRVIAIGKYKEEESELWFFRTGEKTE